MLIWPDKANMGTKWELQSKQLVSPIHEITENIKAVQVGRFTSSVYITSSD